MLRTSAFIAGTVSGGGAVTAGAAQEDPALRKACEMGKTAGARRNVPARFLTLLKKHDKCLKGVYNDPETIRNSQIDGTGNSAMNILQILDNHLLVNSLIAWAAAQIMKTILYTAVHKKLDIHRLFGDGGMPSGHSATVTAMATTAALQYGLDSPIFSITAIVAIVVMHDAMGVRREAGKHAKVLNNLLVSLSADIPSEDVLKEFLGHTPLQVCFGALLGLGVALLLS